MASCQACSKLPIKHNTKQWANWWKTFLNALDWKKRRICKGSWDFWNISQLYGYYILLKLELYLIPFFIGIYQFKICICSQLYLCTCIMNVLIPRLVQILFYKWKISIKDWYEKWYVINNLILFRTCWRHKTYHLWVLWYISNHFLITYVAESIPMLVFL